MKSQRSLWIYIPDPNSRPPLRMIPSIVYSTNKRKAIISPQAASLCESLLDDTATKKKRERAPQQAWRWLMRHLFNP